MSGYRNGHRLPVTIAPDMVYQDEAKPVVALLLSLEGLGFVVDELERHSRTDGFTRDLSRLLDTLVERGEGA